MIKVLFFAQVRELVNTDELSLPCDYATAEGCGPRCVGAVNAGHWRWNPANCCVR